MAHVASGLLAGSFATVTTQPFDLLKTRVQLQPSKYPNFLDAFGTVLREEGLLGLYRGTVPRLIRKTLSSAVTWTVYEELRRLKHS